MKFKAQGIYRDIAITFLTEFAVLAGFFIIYRLLANYLGPNGLGEYSLMKRLISLFQPFLFLGLGVGLSRYLAMANDKNQRKGYMQAGGGVIVLVTVAFLVIINIFKVQFSTVFFGGSSHADLVAPFSVLLAGIIFHTLVYSFFRGGLMTVSFNALQAINLTVMPVMLIIFLQDADIKVLIYSTGWWTLAISFIFSLYFIKNIFLWAQGLKKCFIELLTYSLPRFVGDLFLAGIFSFGPIMAAHTATIKEVGYLSVSQSLLSSAGTIISPLGLILLPKISSLIAKGKRDYVSKKISLLIAATVQCSAFLCLQLVIFSDMIVGYWLGPEFLPAVPTMQVTFIGVFFYNFYIAVRSVLDASVVRPINTINLLVSFIFLVLISFILAYSFASIGKIVALSAAFTIALALLGILTYLYIKKIYPEEGYTKDINSFLVGTSFSAVIALIALALKPLIVSSIFTLIFFEAVAGLAYLLILFWIKTDWLLTIKDILIQE
jgi:O-antigen/teichoic acid export membrane protein